MWIELLMDLPTVLVLFGAIATYINVQLVDQHKSYLAHYLK
ncbi:hypothetical protein [Anabaena sp. PCC 7108]